MIEPVGYLIVGLFAIGMGASFLAADPHSPTSRALSVLFILLGVVFVMNIPSSGRFFGESQLPWNRFFSLGESAILVAGCEWVLRMSRIRFSASAPAPSGDRPLRIAQGLACLYGLLGAVWPQFRIEFWNGPWTRERFLRPEYYVFAVPFGCSLGIASARVAQLLRAQIDPAERLRLLALSFATPFICAALTLPPAWKPVSFAIGELVFLVGAILYHVRQGQRGQFLARFVSPQVLQMVQERGMASVLPHTRAELSVVACDLRGFTAFSETAAPEEIISLLEAYYGSVGEVVSRFGGSIKDLAGDGILALVGAPIAYPDHAQRAVGMALEIRARARAILSHWDDLGLHLGLGIGIASGFVTVGVIGSAQRLEYTAVGPAVNLAARLCARAEAGQILVDQRIVGSVGEAPDGYRFERLDTAELKGFARPVTIFAIISREQLGIGSVGQPAN